MAKAVDRPRRLCSDEARARRVLEVVRQIPIPCGPRRLWGPARCGTRTGWSRGGSRARTRHGVDSPPPRGVRLAGGPGRSCAEAGGRRAPRWNGRPRPVHGERCSQHHGCRGYASAWRSARPTGGERRSARRLLEVGRTGGRARAGALLRLVLDRRASDRRPYAALGVWTRRKEELERFLSSGSTGDAPPDRSPAAGAGRTRRADPQPAAAAPRAT